MSKRRLLGRDFSKTYIPEKELLCAIVMQAVSDLSSRSETIRKNAEEWLLSEDCILSAEMGKKIVEERRKHGKD